MKTNLIRLGAALGAMLVAAPALAQDLTFWSWRQEDRAAYEQFIDTFEAANPGITVKFETFEAANYNTILSTALAGGTGPDVMMVRAYGGLENVASAGYLEPLSTETVPALADFNPAAIAAETMRSDGQIYAVPFASQTQFVIYNKAIFDANGIAEPQTWDVLQADSGIMYFANNAGVLEFDGRSWRLIELPSRLDVRWLVKDPRGSSSPFASRIYVGATGDFGFLAPDSHGQLQFRSLLPPEAREDKTFDELFSPAITPDGIAFQSRNRICRWDDETLTCGATMARYVAEGAEVTLVTCTLGEEGEILVPSLAQIGPEGADQLGGYRISELSAACAALGVTDHRFLGGAGHFRDSGMMGLPQNSGPRAFWSADLDVAGMVELRGRVVAAGSEQSDRPPPPVPDDLGPAGPEAEALEGLALFWRAGNLGERDV